MGSRGRRNATYVKTRELFKTGQWPCHVCGERPGTSVDHVPPLSSFPMPEMWVGRYLPACLPCQRQEGARITNGHTRPKSRRW